MRLLVIGACALVALALAGPSPSTPSGALLTYGISYRSLGRPTGPLTGRICLAYPDGSHTVRVLSKGDYREPAWSPDGRRLAFTSALRQSIISVVPRKGGQPIQIASGGGPTWTPDGTRIVFAGIDGAGRDEIASIRPNGTDRRVIIPGATAPAFSPDGTKLAYIRRAGSPIGAETDVFVANADGTEERRLTNSPEGEAGPTWSPDGSLIAFTRLKLDRDDRRWVLVVRSDSGEEVAVIRGPHSAFDPSWRRPVNLPTAKRPSCF